MSRPSVLFLGKKAWSARALRHLVDLRWDVRAVVCRDPSQELDREEGTLQESARRMRIPTLAEPELPDCLSGKRRRSVRLENLDFVVSYLFWKKIGSSLLALPSQGAINFHPAPLPDLRGLGGYNVAILERMRSYGVSAHFMAESIDAGDIIRTRRFAIRPDQETAFSLERRSMEEMLKLFVDVMKIPSRGRPLPRRPQGKGRYIDRAEFERMRRIMPDDSAEVVERKCRAFFYPPHGGAFVEVGGREFTVLSPYLLSIIGERLQPRAGRKG
jgi:methionyl-tRNA formyltransferase